MTERTPHLDPDHQGGRDARRVMLTVRLTQEEYDQLGKDAEHADVTISELIRERLFAEYEALRRVAVANKEKQR